MAEAKKTEETPDFEQALKELESLVEQMETGELSLEDSLARFERGITLTRICQEALSKAQLRVDELLEKTDDEATGEGDGDS